MVRYLLGDDLWWKAIHHYVTKFAQQNVTTADFARAIDEATGRNLDWFFDQYVYRQGYPEFEVTYEWDDELRSARLKVAQKQEVNDQNPLFRMPVEVSFLLSTGRQRFKVDVREKEQSFYFALPEKPRVVSFDPDNWVLKTLDFKKSKEQLIQELKESDAIMDRIGAAEGLAKIGGPDAVAALQDALLHDPFWGVRVRVARALGAIRSAAARDALIAGLQNEDSRVRRAVVTALGEFRGDETAADALLPVAEHDDSYFVEGEAAKSLGRIRSTRAFGEMERALSRTYHDAIGQVLVFEGFAELRDERAIPIAKDWARYGRPPRAREAAISALGKLGNLSEEKREDVIDFLRPFLDDPWLGVRTRTVGALRELRATKALGDLQRVAEADLDGRAQRAAREAIQAIREGETKDEEVKKLRDELDDLRNENRALRDRLDKLEVQIKGVAQG
jgi:aminopeptidase N